MGKLAVLELNGEFRLQELQAKLKIGVEGEASSIGETGTLPANPTLATYLDEWRQAYRSLAMPTRIVPKQISYGRLTSQLKNVQLLAMELLNCMAAWLASESFRSIDATVRTALDPSEAIRILIQTESLPLRQLPWHCWALLDDYAHAEIAFAAPKFQPVTPNRRIAKEKVQILAILGHSEGINVQQDRQFLERIPEADVTFLVEPERKTINDQLWSQPWDILFFAGHSGTQDHQGEIYCNPQASLSLDDFQYGLRKAIAQGLQLAIFNSCDGLGLMRSLESLHFPQLIVMREPIPDWVAQEFLKQFLQSFTTGQSLYQSVRDARERLHGLEDQFPCASWLPIICQNPAIIPPSWWTLVNQTGQTALRAADLTATDRLAINTAAESIRTLPNRLRPPNNVIDQAQPWFSSWRLHRRLGRHIQVSLLVSLAVLMLFTGIRHQGWLQPLELMALDQMMRLRPDEGMDSGLLIVEVTDADIQLQQQNQERLQRRSTSAQTFNQLFDISLSDDSLNRLLKALKDARVIGLDIYRDFPVEPHQVELAAQLQHMPQLITTCKAEDFYEANIPTIDAPPEVPLERIGFSDFVPDQDGLLRRHLLGMLHPLQTPTSRCNANTSFSAQIAFYFLRQQGIAAEFTPIGDLRLGERVLKVLRSRPGGYRGLKSGGSQLLLNYRATAEIAPRVTLAQVLQNTVNPAYVKDKIVLVGVTASGGEDRWSTLYGAGASDQMPGVIVQAHMVSQLVNAALGRRPLLQAWAGWRETSWIGAWAIIGTVLAWLWNGQWTVLRWFGAIATVAALLYAVCFSALLKGYWIPFAPSLLAVLLASFMVLAYRRYLLHPPLSMQPRKLILRR